MPDSSYTALSASRRYRSATIFRAREMRDAVLGQRRDLRVRSRERPARQGARILLILQRTFRPVYCEWPQEATGPDADHRTMKLSDIERDKLLLTVAAELAWRRRARGLRLNYPETVAVLSSYVLEGARDGRTVAELMDGGRSVLKRSEVMDGIPEMLAEVQMEATFPDGTKLVTIHEPLR